MGVEVPAIGSAAWGGPLNTALGNMAHRGYDPEDGDGPIIVWNYGPIHITGLAGTNPASGTVRMVRMPRLVDTKTINSIGFFIGSAVVTPTVNQCFAGIYNSSGVRLGVTADISGQLGVTGMRWFALTAPTVVPAGDYYATILVNAAGVPSLATANAGALHVDAVNMGAPAVVGFVTDGPTAQTSLPANITMASRTLSTHGTWAGMR